MDNEEFINQLKMQQLGGLKMLQDKYLLMQGFNQLKQELQKLN
jgi:hypothetical protein